MSHPPRMMEGMKVYWLKTAAGWRRHPDLEVLDRAVKQLPADAEWTLYRQPWSGAKLQVLRTNRRVA